MRSLSPGKHRPQVHTGAVAKHDRNRGDERRKTLARNAHQSVHPAGQFEHGGERIPIAHPARQRIHRDHRRGPRRIAQQGDLADDQTGRHLADGDGAIVTGVDDLGPPGFDRQEGHRRFALPHQHVFWRRGQRPQLGRQRRQRLSGAAGEEVQFGEFVGADNSLAGHR